MLPHSRNLLAYWILGLCNNFAYVIMLSAAMDILNKAEGGGGGHVQDKCNETIVVRACTKISTGSVLIADILPALIIKLSAPLFVHRVPFGMRHLITVLAQATSFITVALSESAWTALMGVAVASFGSGFGEISYLSLSAHFPATVVTAWSSGTGGAGLLGSFAYAFLTDERLLHLSPKTTLLAMLTVPVLFAIAFWYVLLIPHTVHRVNLLEPSTYVVSRSLGGNSLIVEHDSDDEAGRDEDEVDEDLLDVVQGEESSRLLGSSERQTSDFHDWGFWTKLSSMKRLYVYIVPLVTVYFGEYFINQGLLELHVFSCSQGFGLAPSAQYRWLQVLYQVGVFISRSFASSLRLPGTSVFATLQLVNAAFLTCSAIWTSTLMPHFALIAAIVLYEGLLGGSAYVCTFKAVHKKIPADRREFALGIVSVSDTFGILLAGVAAIPTHNAICGMPL